MPTYQYEVGELGWPQTKYHWLSGGTVLRSATFVVKTSRSVPSLKEGSPMPRRKRFSPAFAGAPFCVPGLPVATVSPPGAHDELSGAEGTSSLPHESPFALLATTR